MSDLNLKSADAKFIHELTGQPGGEKVRACFTCKTCSASCPITAVNETFNPLRIIRLALYGFREQVLGSDFIWLCSSCYSCQERCPQGVCIADFMTLLKNMAVKAGYAPTGIRAQKNLVTRNGRIYPLDDFDNKKRKKMGLPQLPTTCEVVKKLFPEE